MQIHNFINFQGMPVFKKEVYGDLIIKFQIAFPNNSWAVSVDCNLVDSLLP